MASKQDILKFISSEGFSASGYEEQILNKFAAFLEAPAPVVEAPAEEVVEEPKAKAKK